MRGLLKKFRARNVEGMGTVGAEEADLMYSEH